MLPFTLNNGNEYIYSVIYSVQSPYVQERTTTIFMHAFSFALSLETNDLNMFSLSIIGRGSTTNFSFSHMLIILLKFCFCDWIGVFFIFMEIRQTYCNKFESLSQWGWLFKGGKINQTCSKILSKILG